MKIAIVLFLIACIAMGCGIDEPRKHTFKICDYVVYYSGGIDTIPHVLKGKESYEMYYIDNSSFCEKRFVYDFVYTVYSIAKMERINFRDTTCFERGEQ